MVDEVVGQNSWSWSMRKPSEGLQIPTAVLSKEIPGGQPQRKGVWHWVWHTDILVYLVPEGRLLSGQV